MKIALIHDYLVNYGGAEKTFKTLTEIFPEAEIFTLFYTSEVLNKLKIKTNKKIKTSFLQKFPKFFKKHYKLLLLLMPIAIESFDLREFDLVISSCHSFSKGVVIRPKTTHICYCYSPTRYLWDNARHNIFLNYFRIWGRQASERVDKFIAISKIVQQRIKKYYKQESIIIYPPVEISTAQHILNTTHQDEYYLIISQLRKYKRIDLAVEAFNKLGLKLVIIGEGQEKNKLKRIAEKNIKFLGWQPEEKINEYYKNCAAFIFPGEDDFGIAPVEAMSHGKPVLAYKKGGAMETIIEGKTGEFFEYQTPAALSDGVRRLRENLKKYDANFIQNHARQFSEQRFKKEFMEFIADCYKIS